MSKLVIDCATGRAQTVPLTAADHAKRAKGATVSAARRTTKAARATQRQADLDTLAAKLGDDGAAALRRLLGAI